jgi:hypothetical protein
MFMVLGCNGIHRPMVLPPKLQSREIASGKSAKRSRASPTIGDKTGDLENLGLHNSTLGSIINALCWPW